MTPIVQTEFTEELLQLLKETFEGPAPTGPGAFLNKGTGLIQTLDDLSAEVASAQPRMEASTVAAHTEHIRFYVAVHYKLMLGARDTIDWDVLFASYLDSDLAVISKTDDTETHVSAFGFNRDCLIH